MRSRNRGESTVKYFFLAPGWTIGRVWELGGLWNANVWRREPEIERLDVHLVEQGEPLWLYRVEDAVIMVEVQPEADVSAQPFGQVVLKRLMSAEQALDRLARAGTRY